jgi:hypothetical protein
LCSKIFSTVLRIPTPKIVVMACWESSTTGNTWPNLIVEYRAMMYEVETQKMAAI